MKLPLKTSLLILMSSLGWMGCRSTQSDLKVTEIPADVSRAKAKTGSGWDADRERFVGDCLVGTTEDIGSQTSSVRYTSSMSKEELHSMLGFSMSAKAKYGIYKGSAAANFQSENSEDKFSSVTVYSARYEFKNRYFTPTDLSPVGQRIHDQDAEHGGGIFEQGCGHEYVQQKVVGATLLMAARIDFISEEAKSQFNAKFKIKGSAFSAKGELSKAAYEFREMATVTITLFQKGGDVGRISTAFTNGEAKNGFGIIRCSMADVDPCVEVLSNIVDYATSEKPGDFTDQIKDNGANGGAADLMYIAYPYITAGVFPTDSLLRELLYEQRRKIEEKLNRNIFLRNRKNMFQTLSVAGAGDMYDKLDQAERHNQGLITRAIRDCYDAVKQETCEASTGALFADFKDFPDSELEIKEADLPDCEKGYVREGVGCERVTCPSGYRYEDEWSGNITGGTGDYICDENAKDTLVKVDCSDKHEEKGLSCIGRSCGSHPHDTTWIDDISNGKGNFRCDWGTSSLQSVASCNSGYKKSGTSCIKPSVVVPPKKGCRDAKGRSLKDGDKSTIKSCNKNKYEQRHYTCKDGTMKFDFKVELGRCGGSGGGGRPAPFIL